MRIAVTGSTGFIGRHIANHLVGAGHDVLAYGRRETPLGLHPLAKYHQWDITEPQSVPRVEAVIHSAAHVADWGSYQQFYSTNVIGTRNVLEAFASSGLFIHMSTASVYARPAAGGNGLTESDAVVGGQKNDYGRTKALAEIEVLQSGRPAMILRPRAVYGEGDTNLLPRLMRASKLGHVLAVGDGNNEVSITHVENIAHAIERCLEFRSGTCVYNVADEKPIIIGELLSAIAEAAGLSPKVWYIPRRLAMPTAALSELLCSVFRPPRQPFVTRYAVSQLSEPWKIDISRAIRHLGYQPNRTYRDALPWIRAKYNRDVP